MAYERDLLPDAMTYYEGRGLKFVGAKRSPWKTTRCEFHGGSDSMRIFTSSGGFRCMSCDVSGGDVLSYQMQVENMELPAAAKAIGAWKDDGKPQRVMKPTSLSPRQSIQVVSTESNLVTIAAHNVANGVEMTEEDLHRLRIANHRIQKIMKEFE